MYFDFTILILQMFFSNREQILYGILLVCIYTFALEKVLIMGKSKTQVEIVSDKYKEINELITTKFDRGTTLVSRKRWVHSQIQPVPVLTVKSREQCSSLQYRRRDHDEGCSPAAFIIISQVNEVKGRGFTLQKKYEVKDEASP